MFVGAGSAVFFRPLTLTKSTARRRTDIHENSNSAYCFCEIWIAPEWATRHSQWEYSGSVDLRIEIAMLEDVAVLHLSQFCRENLQWYYKFEPALHTSKRMHFIEGVWGMKENSYTLALHMMWPGFLFRISYQVRGNAEQKPGHINIDTLPCEARHSGLHEKQVGGFPPSTAESPLFLRSICPN